MRSRLTVTKRIADDLYLSGSVYPKIQRPSGRGMVLAFFLGAALFTIVCLLFIAVFAP